MREMLIVMVCVQGIGLTCILPCLISNNDVINRNVHDVAFYHIVEQFFKK